MRISHVSWLASAIGLLAATSATAQDAAADPAQAAGQPQGEAALPQSDIVVEAPRLLPVPPENLPTEPMTRALATVKIYVLHEDLDLSQPAGARQLMDRIEKTARQACDYLDVLYPLVDDPDCAKRAAANAAPAAKAAIAAASEPAEGEEQP